MTPGPSAVTGPTGSEGPEPLDRVSVVLVETQDVVNIAGVVRAMMNTGLSDLRLVRPVEFDAYRIEGIAHRSNDVLDRVQFFDSLEDALADTVYAMGTSARGRAAARNYVRPRAFAPELLSMTSEGRVAVVLGREDRGLENHELDLCQSVAVVPTSEYTSLNLAQAFLIIGYELMLAATEEFTPFRTGKRALGPASHENLEEMYAALEQGLERITFFKARKPEAVMRSLRTILSQARMDRREAKLLAAIGYEMRHYQDRRSDKQEETSVSDP